MLVQSNMAELIELCLSLKKLMPIRRTLLNEDGMPAPVAEVAEEKVASAPANPSLRNTTSFVLLVTVHGKADGPGLAMNPRPRNLADKAWQAKTPDENIIRILNEAELLLA